MGLVIRRGVVWLNGKLFVGVRHVVVLYQIYSLVEPNCYLQACVGSGAGKAIIMGYVGHQTQA